MVLADEIQNNVEINKASKREEEMDFNKESAKVPSEHDPQKFIPLASIDDDEMNEADVERYSEKEREDVNEKTSLESPDEITTPLRSEHHVDGPPKVDEDHGIQMQKNLNKEEVSDGKQIRKFTAKDRESVIDIMPKIKEHVELSNDAIQMSDYTDKDAEQLPSNKAEPEFESHHRDKVVSLHHLERPGHKRHHHHHRRHRKHEVKQHRTISEREALAEKFRLRSGLLTLQETEPRVDDFAKTYLKEEEEEGRNLQKKDLDEIACKMVLILIKNNFNTLINSYINTSIEHS